MKKLFEKRYFGYRERLKLKEKTILFVISPECYVSDIPKAFLKELADNRAYKDYTVYLSGNSKKNCGRIKMLSEKSLRYSKILATAKYLVFVGAPAHYFAKRKGQVCLNIPPIPTKEKQGIALVAEDNSQKGFYDADFLFCQSKEDAVCLIKNYMLENFAKAKIWTLQVSGKDISGAGEVANALCRQLLRNEKNPLLEEWDIPYNGKKNVLIYMGGLGKNGLTTSGANLLHTLDRTKNNYAVFCCVDSIKQNTECIRVVPEDVPVVFYRDFRCLTLRELVPYVLWRGLGILPFKKVKAVVTSLGKRNAQRMLSGCRIDTAIQFTGYNDDMIATMEHLPCKRIIFVHSDMEKEISHRRNVNGELLGHAYKAYDNVAVVTKEMIPPAGRIAGGEANFVLCPNVIDKNRISEQGRRCLEFDKTTIIHSDIKALLEALSSDKKKFVSVGRFSVEKGHGRLIRAFERLHKEQPDTCLIIIGGSGNLWDKTVSQAQESSCPDAIFLVREMSNPFPLMKQCDCLVLPSLYEGFGLVLAEADVLGIPCFTVDIDGPRSFMQDYGGRIVENSEAGIYEGMLDALQTGRLQTLSVDYEEYNKNAIARFEGLL